MSTVIRRRVAPLAGLALSAALVAGLAPSAPPADAQPLYDDVATGVVFEDLDADSVHDPDEPGVPDVSVSNGREVVRTDADGRYELGVTDETILFVTKPVGYMVPLDEDNLPQFFYRHYPDGSAVDTFYPGIEPTGPLPASVDFPLVATEETDRFEAVVFADPQTRSFDELEDFRVDVVEELVGVDATFGLTVGDIVNDPLDLFEPHNDIVAEIGIPWWNLPGNHDMNYDVPSDEHATETYKRVYGPTDYSVDYGQVHFVNMDNVQYFGEDEGGYRGYVNEQQLTWLANDHAHVPSDKLIVISTHIPLRTEAIGGASLNTVNLDELFEVLEGRHVYALSGHDTSNSWQMYLEPGEVRTPPPGVNTAVWDGPGSFHNQTLAEVRGSGWPTGPLDERGVQAADMSDGNPNGYYFIEFDGTDYTPRFKPASLPADYQMRITFRGGEGNDVLDDGDPVWIPSGPSGSGPIEPTPRFATWDFTPRCDTDPLVEVNVFDGGEKHTVEASFDGGEFAPMDYDPPAFGLTDGDPTANMDPYVQSLHQDLVGSPERPAGPQPSSHLWRAEVPALSPGTHTVTVRSTDPYGQVSESSAEFAIDRGRPDRCGRPARPQVDRPEVDRPVRPVRR